MADKNPKQEVYYRQHLWRIAREETREWVLGQTWRTIVAAIAIFLITGGITYWQQGEEEVEKLILPAVIGVGSILIVYGAIFLSHLFYITPRKLMMAKQSQLDTFRRDLSDARERIRVYETQDLLALDLSGTSARHRKTNDNRDMAELRFTIKNFGTCVAFDPSSSGWAYVSSVDQFMFPILDGGMTMSAILPNAHVVIPVNVVSEPNQTGEVAERILTSADKQYLVIKFRFRYTIGDKNTGPRKSQDIWVKCDLDILFKSNGGELAALYSVPTELEKLIESKNPPPLP
ncbi:MAG: hypothetical protein P4L99_15515 [Chthoniobacter sp.]|nr:hypothetical protein [Chthoniobacter sp.]